MGTHYQNSRSHSCSNLSYKVTHHQLLLCRTHKLFIITSGGCSNLSDKFYNCLVDIRGSQMTVDEVLESEEAYYLRRINGRNNARWIGQLSCPVTQHLLTQCCKTCRILKRVAEDIGLSIPCVVDTCAYDPYEIAVCTTETMVNNMHRQRDGRISVLVKCVDTTRVENGILCCMHPAEGFWLFKVQDVGGRSVVSTINSERDVLYFLCLHDMYVFVSGMKDGLTAFHVLLGVWAEQG